MTLARHNVRLPAALEKALRKLAHEQGVTPYAMLQRSVQAGIAAQTMSNTGDSLSRELVAEVASMSARLADLERIVDRTLFTACAAYCYARNAAAGGGKTDDIILGEINRAYDRQRALAEGRS
ncbi:hypothetical protein BSY18_4005 (plasmid) [Blastomonas sp. RAC04]|uniref:hypothetical protein n=1 Tax=Blastomonas sp. RAC04 TaxID=1842535 RepID=UPI00083DD9B7|nr:hypothetical protein [Blastomonas sp. RAC04]AOF98745.1 hypothetical protein BSY18_4005 [Blastomonas sp. RAC04]